MITRTGSYRWGVVLARSRTTPYDLLLWSGWHKALCPYKPRYLGDFTTPLLFETKAHATLWCAEQREIHKNAGYAEKFKPVKVWFTLTEP